MNHSARLKRAVREFEAANYVEARRLLQPLAEAGDAEAQCMLANIYQLGWGIDADGVEAVRWYKAAAAQGSDLACNNLWTIYTAGCVGVPQNKDEARRWYDEAKRRGFPHLPGDFY